MKHLRVQTAGVGRPNSRNSLLSEQAALSDLTGFVLRDLSHHRQMFQQRPERQGREVAKGSDNQRGESQ